MVRWNRHWGANTSQSNRAFRAFFENMGFLFEARKAPVQNHRLTHIWITSRRATKYWRQTVTSNLRNKRWLFQSPLLSLIMSSQITPQTVPHILRSNGLGTNTTNGVSNLHDKPAPHIYASNGLGENMKNGVLKVTHTCSRTKRFSNGVFWTNDQLLKWWHGSPQTYASNGEHHLLGTNGKNEQIKLGQSWAPIISSWILTPNNRSSFFTFPCLKSESIGKSRLCNPKSLLGHRIWGGRALGGRGMTTPYTKL